MTTRPGTRNPITKGTDNAESLVGRTLDSRFRLDSVIKTGGMGIVFQATQLSAGRSVAIKVIRPVFLEDKVLVQRFSQEVEVIGRLSHPNIVQLIDAGHDASGLPFIAMEFVEGDTFRAMLEGMSLSLLEILHVFVQVCDALIEAHRLGIIHRDLKFENIMICRHFDGRIHVKVLDFGVARQLSHDSKVTKMGEVPGTPGIIAPELVDGTDPSAQSDLYSLGVLMFTAFTGRPPFQGNTDYEIMAAHKFQETPDLYELIGDRVPEVVIELAYELMEKEPKLRPNSTTAVRNRLEKIIRRLERQMMDHPRYIPPPQEGLRPLHAPIKEDTASSRSADFLEGSPAEVRATRREDAMVAPTSVVGVLITAVIFLSLAIIYLLFQRYTG